MLKAFCRAVSAGVNAATLNSANGSALGGISGRTAAALEVSIQSQTPTKRSLGNVPVAVVSTPTDTSNPNKRDFKTQSLTDSQNVVTKLSSTDSCGDTLMKELNLFRMHYEDDYAWFVTALSHKLGEKAKAALTVLRARVVEEREGLELCEIAWKQLLATNICEKTLNQLLETNNKDLEEKIQCNEKEKRVLAKQCDIGLKSALGWNVNNGKKEFLEKSEDLFEKAAKGELSESECKSFESDLSSRMNELQNFLSFIDDKSKGPLKAKHIYQSFLPAVGRKLVGGSVKLSGDNVAVREMFEYLMDALIGAINPLEAGLNRFEDLICYYFHYFPRCLGLAADCLRHLQKSCGETALAEQIARLENIRNEVLAKVPEMQDTRHELLRLRAEELKIEKMREPGAATDEMQKIKFNISERAGELQAVLDLAEKERANRPWTEAELIAWGKNKIYPGKEGVRENAANMAAYFAERMSAYFAKPAGVSATAAYFGKLTNRYRPTLYEIKEAALEVLPSKLETNERKCEQGPAMTIANKTKLGSRRRK